jgi:hypothetical protein
LLFKGLDKEREQEGIIIPFFSFSFFFIWPSHTAF